MPAASRPKPDLRAVDEHNRRRFCPDRHRIVWDDTVLEAKKSSRFATDYIGGGLCQAGDTWTMHHVGYGKGAIWRLEKIGKAGWTNTGQFRIEDKLWWATGAAESAREQKVIFNCSHGHYSRRGFRELVNAGREITGRERLDDAPWPGEPSLPEPVLLLMTTYPKQDDLTAAVEQLKDQGWDFSAGRILCPDCITEEAELAAKLARLKALDENPEGWAVAGGLGDVLTPGSIAQAAREVDREIALERGEKASFPGPGEPAADQPEVTFTTDPPAKIDYELTPQDLARAATEDDRA
jgi:hypothetical protein